MTESRRRELWPEPGPEQVQVTLLGVYHMANPGNDAINVEADDVLAPERQRELADLVDRLAAWTPDLVATEWPSERQADLDALYDAYRDEGGDEDLLDERRRNEVVQVGCRLADRLGHDRLAAVDHPMRLTDRLDDPPDLDLRAESERASEELDAYDFDAAAELERDQRRLADGTIPEYLHWCNRESQLHANDGMFAAALTYAEPGEFTGAQLLAAWYERNLRLVQNLWWATGDGTDRVLLVIGSGHVRILRHLLRSTPVFCPVSPLPLLASGE